MSNMTKAELVTALAAKAEVTKGEANKILEALAQTVTEHLNEGRTITLPGLAKFTVKDTVERQMRNPATGETFTRPAGKAVKVSAIKVLKDATAA